MSLKGPDFHTYGKSDPLGSSLSSFMDDSLTSDTWIESNDGDNFVKGGFLYEKGFWGRKVRRIVLTEKSLRILHKRTGIVKKYYSLYSVQNVEAQRCTLVFIVSLYTAKGKMKRLYFEPSSAEQRKEWMKAIQVCVAFVKAAKEEREKTRYGTSARRASSKIAESRRHSGEWSSQGSGSGWESVEDRPELDGRRPVLSKSAVDLGYSRQRSASAGSGARLRGRPEAALLEENSGYNPFPAVEQWDLEEPETMGQLGIPSGKRGFSRHQAV